MENENISNKFICFFIFLICISLIILKYNILQILRILHLNIFDQLNFLNQNILYNINHKKVLLNMKKIYIVLKISEGKFLKSIVTSNNN